MIRELRRFNVWDKEGRLYILVESATHAVDADRRCSKAGPNSVKTLTDADAIPDRLSGGYGIPKLGIRVFTTKP